MEPHYRLAMQDLVVIWLSFLACLAVNSVLLCVFYRMNTLFLDPYGH
jgi:hypothetical protein